MSVFLLIIAPAVYWMLGMPFLLRRDDSTLLLAPLLGGAVAGLLGELSLAAGLPAKVVMTIALLTALVCLLFYGRNRRTLISLRDAYGFTLIALLPALFSPFPILGTWDGDWLFLYESGRTVLEGGTFSSESLQRPPLFGAATIPLWLFSEGLVPYQLFATVMSAGALGACLFALHRFAPACPSPARIILFIVIVPFFLHHTAAAWGKLMAAALLITAATELSRPKDSSALWWSGVWFALAVAVHQSSLVYAPVLLAMRVITRGWKTREMVYITGIFAVTGILLVGLFEWWTIALYGLDRKISVNPSVAQRDSSVSLAGNTFLVIFTSFVGWSPLESLSRWFQQTDALSTKRIVSELFWFVTSWVQCLAGTFLGTFFPLLLAGGKALAIRLLREILTPRGAILSVASLTVVILNGILSPNHSSNGTMQAGLTGLGLAGLLVLSVLLLEVAPRRWPLALGITAACGTLPWFTLNLATSIGLKFSSGFRTRFVEGSEGDWLRLSEHHLIPLGLQGFPYLQTGLLLVLLVAFLRFKTSLRLSPDQRHV